MTSLKSNVPPLGHAWFYHQIPTSTIGMNRRFDLYCTVAFLCPKSNAPPLALGPILEVKCCQIPYQSPPLPVQGVVGPNIDRFINHPNTIPSSYDQESHNPHINSSQDLPPHLNPASNIYAASERDTYSYYNAGSSVPTFEGDSARETSSQLVYVVT